MAYAANMRVWRGDLSGGALADYEVEVNEGEVVLDIIHRLQQTQTPDLAVRWNCKAGKCGSCSAEVNGRPRLMCMTRMLSLIHISEPTRQATISPCGGTARRASAGRARPRSTADPGSCA